MTELLSPFKWAGSKRMELAKIRKIVGDGLYSVIEPFMGTGIVSGSIGRPGKCFGNDLNERIIAIFNHSQNKEFVDVARDLMQQINYTKGKYYECREAYNNMQPPERLSARGSAYFFYLQNLAHFGLYRIGKNNKYTSTYHYLEKPLRFEERLTSLRTIKDAFSRIECLDYRDILKSIEGEQYDLMFIDPPYIKSSYSDYSVGGGDFTVNDLHYLDEYCKFLLTKRGIPSIICNYSTDNDGEIYRNATRFVKFSTVRQMRLQDVKRSNFKQSVYVVYGDFSTAKSLDEFL